MPFSATERVSIREYMGAPALKALSYQPLETAMNSAGDDIALATRVRAILVDLESIDTERKKMRPLLIAHQGDDATVDAARAIAALCQDGYRIAMRLARSLGFDRPMANAFNGRGP